MNDIEKLLKLADKASEGNLGTTKISWTINSVAIEAEMQANREIARRETLAEMNRERKSALDQVFSEFCNIFGGLEE
jgi:hypothetical protein